MSRVLALSCSDLDLNGNRVIPERALLYAYLERALRDLTPTCSDDQKHRRQAIRWFKGDKNTAFTFTEVIEELGLTHKSIQLIKAKVALAICAAKIEEKHYERLLKRKAYRKVRSQLVKKSRMPFRPENPTVQWNNWNIGCSVSR